MDNVQPQTRFRYTPNLWRYLVLAVIVVMALNFGENMIRKLIYFPETSFPASDLAALKDAGFLTFEETGGYLKSHPNPKIIIVAFHGNAGHAGQRTYMVQPFLDEPCNIFLAEYPGYGSREGSPSETALYRTAFEDILKLKREFPETPVVLMGESLGTGVVSWLIPKIMPLGAILVSPYTSLVEAAKTHFPFLPVSTLLKDRYDSTEHLKGQKVPALFVHGKNDEVVPFALGQSLYDSYTGPKKMIPLEGRHHNDLPWLDVKGEMVLGIKEWVKGLTP